MLSKKDKEFIIGQTDTLVNEFHSYNLEELNQLKKIKDEYLKNKAIFDDTYHLLDAKSKVVSGDMNEYIEVTLSCKLKIPVDIPCGQVYISEKVKNIFTSDVIKTEGLENIKYTVDKIKNNK